MLKFSISLYAACFVGKVCGPLWSTCGAPLGEDKSGDTASIVNTKVARWANVPQNVTKVAQVPDACAHTAVDALCADACTMCCPAHRPVALPKELQEGGTWNDIYLDPSKPLVLDIGCAKGHYCLEVCRNHSQRSITKSLWGEVVTTMVGAGFCATARSKKVAGYASRFFSCIFGVLINPHPPYVHPRGAKPEVPTGDPTLCLWCIPSPQYQNQWKER